jgi:hypothetical protein
MNPATAREDVARRGGAAVVYERPWGFRSSGATSSLILSLRRLAKEVVRTPPSSSSQHDRRSRRIPASIDREIRKPSRSSSRESKAVGLNVKAVDVGFEYAPAIWASDTMRVER